MFSENEAPLQLSHKRSERYRERHRGPRPLQSLAPNQLPPLVILRAEEYRRQHPERTFLSHKRKHTADFAVHVDKEETRSYDENYTNKIPRIDKTDGKSITDNSITKDKHVRRPSLASIRSQGSRHTLLPASGSSQQQPQSPPPTPPTHQSPQQQRSRTPSQSSQYSLQLLQTNRSANCVVPHKRKHTTDFSVYIDKEETHIHDGKDNNKIPLTDETDGVSITENLATKEPESSSSSPPPPQSPQQQSQSSPRPPAQSPQVPITENLATKEEKSSSPPSQSPQQQAQSPPPPPSQLPQAPTTDDLITKEQESSSPPPLQSPQRQSQSPPQPQSSQQQSQSLPPPPQSPQQRSQSLPPPPQSPQKQAQSPQQEPQSDNHRDTAFDMGGIPDDVDFEIDFDFGDMGASMHDEQEEDRSVRKINRRDSTPVQSRARTSVHGDDDDRSIETTHQMPMSVHNQEKDASENTAAAAATSDEPDMDQHEVLERVIERLADQKVLLINPDAISSIEMIKDKLHEALLTTTVKVTQQKAVAQFKLVNQVLEMIQTAVANVTNIQDDMLQSYLEMFLSYVVGPLGDHVQNLKDQKKSEAKIRRIRHHKSSIRVKMLNEQRQASKIRQEVEQLEEARKKIQKEQESYTELKGFLDALDNMS